MSVGLQPSELEKSFAQALDSAMQQEGRFLLLFVGGRVLSNGLVETLFAFRPGMTEPEKQAICNALLQKISLA